jgi:hypothetical protein
LEVRDSAISEGGRRFTFPPYVKKIDANNCKDWITCKISSGWWHRLSSLCKCVLKVGAAIDEPQVFKMLFIKNIKMISLKFNPLLAQAGKPVPPGSLG